MDVPTYSPREIVGELDRFIVGQQDAKRAVAIALRNRWRRQQLPEGLREEVVPKNILMIGPTGCGKTEIARRLARLAQAPFIKVEATKFTEVGYVGRDVDSIVRDLVEASIVMLREASRKDVAAKAELAAEDRLVTALVGEGAGAETRTKFRRMLRDGELETKEVEVALTDAGTPIGQIDMPGMPPQQMANLGEMMKGMFGRKEQRKRMTVANARTALNREEADRLLDTDQLTADAVRHAEENGIVFLDEIDKVCARTGEGGFRGGDVSREGVQRDLLPLIEGTTVSTKYGPVKTDHVLFIASAPSTSPSPPTSSPNSRAASPSASSSPPSPATTSAASSPSPNITSSPNTPPSWAPKASPSPSPPAPSTRSPTSPPTSTTGSRTSAPDASPPSSNASSKRSASPPPTATATRSPLMPNM